MAILFMTSSNHNCLPYFPEWLICLELPLHLPPPQPLNLSLSSDDDTSSEHLHIKTMNGLYRSDTLNVGFVTLNVKPEQVADDSIISSLFHH